MQFRAGIRLIAIVSAVIWLAPALVLAGAQEEGGGQSSAGAAATDAVGAELPDTPQRPWTYGSHAEFQAATGRTLPALSEAPMLAQQVSSGALPPVAERVPDEPLIVVPIEQIGSYGGQMNTTVMDGPVVWWFPAYWLEDPPVQLRPDAKTWYPNWLLGVDQSADDRTITLRLRPGMKWSDGDSFDAEDVAFWFDDMNLNKELHPTVPTSLNVGGSPAQGRRIDDHTFELSFAAPLPNFALRQLTLPHYMWSMGFIAEPKHYLSQFHISYNAKANDLAKEGGFENWTQLFNARQGPYGKSSDDIGRPVLEAWVLQEAATDYALWERNPFYWKVDIAGNQLPYFDRVQNRSAATKESFMIAAMGGEVDFVASILTIEDFPVLTQNAEAGNYEVRLWQKRAGAGVNYFFRQTYKPDPVIEGLLRDKRFRRALSLAINRAEINELLYFGKGIPSQAAVPPGSIYHVPEHFQRDAEFDPDEANRILDEMGLDEGRRRHPPPSRRQGAVLEDRGLPRAGDADHLHRRAGQELLGGGRSEDRLRLPRGQLVRRQALRRRGDDRQPRDRHAAGQHLRRLVVGSAVVRLVERGVGQRLLRRGDRRAARRRHGARPAALLRVVGAVQSDRGRGRTGRHRQPDRRAVGRQPVDGGYGRRRPAAPRAGQE